MSSSEKSKTEVAQEFSETNSSSIPTSLQSGPDQIKLPDTGSKSKNYETIRSSVPDNPNKPEQQSPPTNKE